MIHRLALLLLLLAAPPALGQVLVDAGADGRVTVRRPTSGAEDRPQLRLIRDQMLIWQTRDRGFEALAQPLRHARTAPPLDGVTGWSGGAYCCWTLHLFARTRDGLRHAGSIPLGKRTPERLVVQREGETLLRIADAAHDFWDYVGSLGADIGPLVPYSWNGRRMAADTAAMRRPADAALGPRCADGMAARSLDVALAELGAAEGWGRFRAGQPHPATEAARIALCLIYAGQARSAERVLAAFPPGQDALREATRRQIIARIACSRQAELLRRLNGPNPLISTYCREQSPDQTAVSTALEAL